LLEGELIFLLSRHGWRSDFSGRDLLFLSMITVDRPCAPEISRPVYVLDG